MDSAALELPFVALCCFSDQSLPIHSFQPWERRTGLSKSSGVPST